MTESARPFSYGPGTPAADPSGKPANAGTPAQSVQAAVGVAEVPAQAQGDVGKDAVAKPENEPEAGPDTGLPESDSGTQPDTEPDTGLPEAELDTGSRDASSSEAEAESPDGPSVDDEAESAGATEAESGVASDEEPWTGPGVASKAEEAAAETAPGITADSDHEDADEGGSEVAESDMDDETGHADPAETVVRRGQITIATSVVEKVATIAARKVPGVYDLGTGAAALIGAETSADQGLAVRLKGQTATIAVTVVVEYGNRVYDVASRIREEVADAVESMLGVDVVSVDIVVEDVHMDRVP